MRSPRVLYVVVPLVAVAILTCTPALAAAPFWQGEDCDALADEADAAYQEWRAASRAAETVAAVYGLFSGEYLLAAIYREIKEDAWEELRDRFGARCLNV